MLDITFTYSDLQFYLLILVRVTCFIYIAPFFGMNNTPHIVKIGLGVLISYLLYGLVVRPEINFDSELDYAIIVMKESVTGFLVGYGAQLCINVCSVAGHLVDTETGMAMAQVFDVNTNENITITSGIYQYAFYLILIASGMYQYLLGALIESFELIPVAGAVFDTDHLVGSMIMFMTDFMSIGFRIALPVFCVILLLNAILGVLAKVAPQMNMFAVGIQLKLLTGLSILYITAFMLPTAAGFVFTEMKRVIVSFVEGMM